MLSPRIDTIRPPRVWYSPYLRNERLNVSLYRTGIYTAIYETASLNFIRKGVKAFGSYRMKMKIDNGLRNSSKCEIYIKEIHIKDSVLNHAEMLQGDTPHDGIPQDSTESSTRLFLTWFGQTRFALSP
jgi:hypothetical protein